MKILVTGSKGFVGRNLLCGLKAAGYEQICTYDKGDDLNLLDMYTKDADFVFHLAGVNRPIDESEFREGNAKFTEHLLNNLQDHGNYAPVLASSSIQALKDNPYGRSKKAAEDFLLKHQKKTGAPVYIYRLPNIFGKWSQPNYNTVVATYCYNIARGRDIEIHNRDTDLHLCYIDDVIAEFINAMEGNATFSGKYCSVNPIHHITLGELAERILGFAQSRKDLFIPDQADALTRKLYSTYLSFLPEEAFAYNLKMNRDNRGSFTEFIRTRERGQVSINVSKPGIGKGNHWHKSKNEKFLVVKGQGVIKLRKVDSPHIIEYAVDDSCMQVVDIPPGYTHSIVNVGTEDLVTVMWVNECFDPDNPDTYHLEV